MHAASSTALCADSGAPSPGASVAPGAATVPNPETLSRVGTFLQVLCSERRVSEAELRQHAIDCTDLMEVAYERFQAYHDPADREHAVLWMHARDEALRLLRERGHTFVDMGR